MPKEEKWVNTVRSRLDKQKTAYVFTIFYMNPVKNSVLLILVLLPFLAVIFICRPSAEAFASSWHMVNINTSGLGDAHVLINGNIVTMIDAGEYHHGKYIVAPYLQKIGVAQIDHFFISHPHNDHWQGLVALLEKDIKVNNIYYNLPPEGVSDFAFNPSEFRNKLQAAEDSGSKLHNIGKNFRLNLPDNGSIKILYAHKERQLGNRNVSVNDYSLVLQWDTEGFRTLFTGDLDYPLGNYLSDKPHFKADLLKVPHHGVTGIAPNSFFDTVNPKLNLFPTPRNLWSHPRIEQAKKWTLEKQIRYCLTGFNGSVVMRFNDSAISLHPEIPTSSCPAGMTDIRPGPKIDEPVALPHLMLLIN